MTTLAELEFRALDVAAPDVDGTTAGIHDRLMGGIVETAMAPAKLDGKSSRSLHIDMHRLTIDVPAGAHADGCLAHAQEVIGAHDIIERLHFQHHVLQSRSLTRLAGRAA